MEKYKNLKEFETAIKINGCPDSVEVNNIIYTLQEYDLNGQTISYGNKRTETGFSVETENRYKDGFGDAKIEEYNTWYLRNDIVYLD